MFWTHTLKAHRSTSMPETNWTEISLEYVGRLPKVSFTMIAEERGMDPRTVQLNIKKTLNKSLTLLKAHQVIK